MNPRKTKVLMVCLGNICRSPLAEGILKSMVDPDLIEVDSAGTAGYHIGNPPDERSLAIARQFGIDISEQRCRQVRQIDLRDFDLIYAMDEANLAHLLEMARSNEERTKVRLLLEEVSPGPRDVPDPYYGGTSGFEKVYHLIHEACEAISKKLSDQDNQL